MPNKPSATKSSHTYRLPDAVYDPAKAKAERMGTTVTRVIIRKLGEFLDEPEDTAA